MTMILTMVILASCCKKKKKKKKPLMMTMMMTMIELGKLQARSLLPFAARSGGHQRGKW